MADNVDITAGTGTTVGADEISAVKYQRVKLIHGADGVNDGDVSKANPLPVTTGLLAAKALTQAALSFAASGDNTLVSATAAQKTKCYVLVLVFEGAVGVKIRSGATDLTGVMQMYAGSVIQLSIQTEPHFITATNEALICNLSAAVNVRGWIDYIKD